MRAGAIGNPRFILDLGLVYLVVTAFALGNMFPLGPDAPSQVGGSDDLLDRSLLPDVRSHRAQHSGGRP
jgi:hypothetical protein